MKHLDLFSGIGGFALAASWVWGDEHEIHSFVEIDPFCQKVLNKHWPDVPIHSDIKDYKHDGTAIDLLTGGFPCQPYSIAGKRRGEKDDRSLWEEMLRIIDEVGPYWVIGENVTNFIRMGLDKALLDLERIGYTARPFNIPACAVGALHARERIFIIANPKGYGRKHAVNGKNRGDIVGKFNAQISTKGVSVGNKGRFYEKVRSSKFIRRANGIPNRVDRIKALGNAIVPQVVVPIMQAIKNLGV